MKTSDFDYRLPPEAIAQAPAEPRDSSRLLVLHRADGHIEHGVFRDLETQLLPGDLLVLNDTRVRSARLYGRKSGGGGRIELLLIDRREGAGETWESLARPARSLREGTWIDVECGGRVATNGDALLRGEIVGRTDHGGRLIRFVSSDDVGLAIRRSGEMPLPPYIHSRLADPERYQTVFARPEGSAAAPTAGLHFTEGLIDRLRARGIGLAFVTLHVGLGTFRPIKVDQIDGHYMHSEWGELSSGTADAIEGTKRSAGRVVAVGTTVVRVLESAAKDGDIRPFRGRTDLFIRPGHRFAVVDAMITNFHLPRSTLLVLVSAFAGREAVLGAYAEAIRQGYRFYSFGDAMLIV